MPYVTSIERLAIERGRREGEAAAKAAARAELEAERAARKESEAAANAARTEAERAKEASRQEAAEAFHEALALALELKFGKLGIAFAKQLKKVKDLAVLREVQRGIRSAKTVDDLRAVVK